MNQLTQAEKGYIACAIDGEGSISITSSKNIRGMLGVSAFPWVTIANTNMIFLTYISRITGIGIINPQPRQNPKHKLGFVWKPRKHEMQEFLETIQPYLIIKRDQCEIVLEFLRRKWSWPLTDEDNTLRRVMLAEMTELNKRGM
jgi:hypothetical protein